MEPSDELNQLAELTEAECLLHLQLGAPEPVLAALDIAADRIGGGVVLSMRNDPTGYWSKALGFGFTEPVSANLIERITDFYRAQHNRGAVLQLSPDRLPSDWDDICTAHNISVGSWWVKLGCRADEVQPGKTELTLRQVEPDEADRAVAVLLDGFGMPAGDLSDMMAAALEDGDRFRAFGAWDDDDLAAVGWLFLNGPAAQLTGAVTRPSHRGRGAQSALIAMRAAAAVEAGCEWLFAETGRPTEGTVNVSLNNLVRSGLRPMYDRRNWLWQPAPFLL